MGPISTGFTGVRTSVHSRSVATSRNLLSVPNNFHLDNEVDLKDVNALEG